MRSLFYYISLLLTIGLFVQVSFLSPEELELRSAEEFFSSSDLSSDTEQKMLGVKLVEAEDGVKRWDMIAESAESLKTAELWKLNQSKVTFFAAAGVTYLVESVYAKFNVDNKDMHFFGGVDVVSSDGYRFTTQDLKYFSESSSLVAQDSLGLSYRGKSKEIMNVTGKTMNANLNTNQIQVLGEVASEQISNFGKKMKINSDSVIFDKQSGNSIARFNENVKVIYQKYLIKGAEAIMEMDRLKNEVNTFDLLGGVELTSKTEQAFSEKLSIDAKINKIVMTGKPRLLKSKDELVGESITFSGKDDKIKVEGAKAHIQSGKPVLLDGDI
ncbi:MAG: LPS export ABC transporter periplasmic protein LptC [Bdellovibrionales bacterium]